MKNIKLHKYLGPSKVNPKGEMRYFLIGLDNPSEYSTLITILVERLGLLLEDKTDNIWFRMSIFKKDNNKLKMYWDEDLGVFFIEANHSDKESEWLEKLIREAIPFIEAKMSAN